MTDQIDGGRVLEIIRERWPLQFEIAVLTAQLEAQNEPKENGDA